MGWRRSIGLLVFTFFAISPTSGKAGPDAAFAVLDYGEAAAAGIDVSVPEGMPLCELNPDWPGYATEAEALIGALEAEARPECAADPRLAEYVVGAPQPTADHSQDPYHHNGQQTNNQNFEGGRGDFNPKNIGDIPHESGNLTRFVVARFLVKKTASPTGCQNPSDTVKWAESGWSEVSWSTTDQRRVYTWGTADCTWRFYDQQFNIQDGQFYSWRVAESNNDLNTSILWNGQWQLLHSYNLDCSPTVCAVESYIEIYSTVNGSHPGWTGRLTAKSMDVRQSSWKVWGTSIQTFTGDVNPYHRCAVTNYSEFDVIDSGSC